MKLIIIVQTFFLVIAKFDDYCYFTVSTLDKLYNFQCTLMMHQECWSQLCNCASNNKRSTDGGQSPLPPTNSNQPGSFLRKIECEYISKVTTSNPTSNLTTEHTGSSTDASTHSVPHSATSQQELNTISTDSTTSKVKLSCSAMLGATVVLAVLLILAIVGWVCTCVTFKKKGAVNINKTYTSEMQTKYRNEYHNENGNTQQESSEDQVEQDLNTERVYDVIDTPAVVHNTTTTNIEEASTEQHTYTATEQQQMSQNDPHGHEDMESHSDRQNQTRLDDGNEEDQTSTHIYHILEQQSEEHVELKDHKQAVEYEVPVTNTAVHHQ